MKKLLKILAIIMGIIIVLLFSLYLGLNEDVPLSEEGLKAEELTEKMLQSINIEAWDSTRYIQWSFREKNHYLWDRKQNTVLVELGNTSVFLNTKTLNGEVYKNGLNNSPLPPAEAEAEESIQKAWSNFCNDSFWLLAFTKLYDEGVTRSYVALEEGKQGLLITYHQGGVTPGDQYLWILDENGNPIAWKMWTSIIPIGGLEFSWQDWITLPTGAKLAQNHTIGSMNISITNVKSWQKKEDSDRLAEIEILNRL